MRAPLARPTLARYGWAFARATAASREGTAVGRHGATCFAGARFLLHLDDDHQIEVLSRDGLATGMLLLAQNPDVTVLVLADCKSPKKRRQKCVPPERYHAKTTSECSVAQSMKRRCRVKTVSYSLDKSDGWCGGARPSRAKTLCADSHPMWQSNRFIVDLERFRQTLPLLSSTTWQGVLDDGIETFLNLRLHQATSGHSRSFGGSRHNILHVSEGGLGLCVIPGVQ